MSYGDDFDYEIKPREVIISIGFIAILLVIGGLISNAINRHVTDQNAVYTKAVRINNDANQFDYVFKTNYGSVLGYGTLESVGTVGDGKVDGYMRIRRVLEQYTMHTRIVCTGSGKTRSCHTQVYWTWDYRKTDNFSVNQVKFMGKTFGINEFPVPDNYYLKTMGCGHHLRHVYYVTNQSYTGTLFTIITDHRLSQSEFRPGVTMDKAVEEYTTSHAKLIFWICYIAFIIVIIAIFYAYRNDWLED